MENKQTAVEYAISKLEKFIEPGNQLVIRVILDNAKDMEKQQIIDAAFHGVDHENSPYENPEDYYNNIYGKV